MSNHCPPLRHAVARGARCALPLLLCLPTLATAEAAPPAVARAGGAYREPPDLAVVSPGQWAAIDRSVSRGLKYLAQNRDADGSVRTYIGGQPAVSAFAAMACMSAGHTAGEGPYGQMINELIDYALACQKPSGMYLLDQTTMPATTFERGSHTGLYNHAITGLMLGEAYGMTDPQRQAKIKVSMEKAIAFARKMQLRKQRFRDEQGGFRYYKSLNGFAGKGDSDLSVTGWFVMFYRSAKNAGFDVPEAYVRDAMAYVRRCYQGDKHAFNYGLHGHDLIIGAGRAVTGAGLLCITLAGEQDAQIARDAGDWLLRHPFDTYGETFGENDRFHYGAYYCSQAALHLGGDYWTRIYPTLAKTLLDNQQQDGSWPPESAHNDHLFGSTYTTCLSVLTLTSPYQVLPIYQR